VFGKRAGGRYASAKPRSWVLWRLAVGPDVHWCVTYGNGRCDAEEALRRRWDAKECCQDRWRLSFADMGPLVSRMAGHQRSSRQTDPPPPRPNRAPAGVGL